MDAFKARPVWPLSRVRLSFPLLPLSSEPQTCVCTMVRGTQLTIGYLGLRLGPRPLSQSTATAPANSFNSTSPVIMTASSPILTLRGQHHDAPSLLCTSILSASCKTPHCFVTAARRSRTNWPCKTCLHFPIE
jgi:hypothetical protein